jgi:hypothetical protein
MNRTLLTLLVIVFIPVAVGAQTAGQSSTPTECTLTLDKSPTIRGLKLGMTAEQLLALFPGSSENSNAQLAIDRAQGYPHYGVASISFQGEYYPGFKDRFAGIASINTTLFDGQVVELQINYAGPHSLPRGPGWEKVDDFLAKLKEAFHLPDAKDWQYKSAVSKTLKCNGFEIHASIYNGVAAISLIGKPYADVVRERGAAEEERRRREFKP